MKTVREIGSHFSIPVVDAHPSKVGDIHEFLEYVRYLKGAEGFVVTFYNGHRVKMKAEEYLRIHKVKDLINFEKDVWALILDEQLDDLLPMLEPEDRSALADFSSKFNKTILNKANELKWEVDIWVETRGGDQKAFAVEFVNAPNNKFAGNERSLLFKIKAGQDPVKVLRDYIRSQCGSSTNVDRVRNLVNGLKWCRSSLLTE